MKVVIALFMVLCGAPAEAGKKKDRDAFSRPRVKSGYISFFQQIRLQ